MTRTALAAEVIDNLREPRWRSIKQDKFGYWVRLVVLSCDHRASLRYVNSEAPYRMLVNGEVREVVDCAECP